MVNANQGSNRFQFFRPDWRSKQLEPPTFCTRWGCSTHLATEAAGIFKATRATPQVWENKISQHHMLGNLYVM